MKMLNNLRRFSQEVTMDQYKRALAEAENTRQRMNREVESAKLFAIQKFALDLLSTVDVLGIALESVPKDKMTDSVLRSLYDGMVMTNNEIHQTLKRHGVVPLETKEHEKFDPKLHNAVFETMDKNVKEGCICHVLKQGYTLHGRVIRATQVSVNKTL